MNAKDAFGYAMQGVRKKAKTKWIVWFDKDGKLQYVRVHKELEEELQEFIDEANALCVAKVEGWQALCRRCQKVRRGYPECPDSRHCSFECAEADGKA